MWNKVAIVVSLILLVSCGGPQPIVIGDLSPASTRELAEKLEGDRLQFETVRYTGTGKVVDDGNSNSFKFDIRIDRDSIVWIDIADPLFGLKVARAFLTPDSVAFLNRINNEYFTGNLSSLQELIKANLDFEVLKNALLGDPFRILPKKGEYELRGATSYELYYFPEKDPIFTNSLPSYYFELDGQNRQLISQMLTDGPRRVESYYSDFSETVKGERPTVIEVKVFAETSMSLTLNIRSYSFDTKIDFPFSIPDSYAPME